MQRPRTNRQEPWGFLPIDRDIVQRCFECGEQTTMRHHVVPVVRGGTRVIPLCAPCHGLVHDKDMDQGTLIREGIEAKRQGGWQPGRPRKLTPETMSRIISMKDQGTSYREIARQLGVSTGTVSNAKRAFTIQYTSD